MKLESQVISLELSKKLQELCVKQESLFYWRDYNSEAGHELIYSPGVFHENAVTVYDYYSAFTASELLESLPSYVGCWLDIVKGRNIMDETDKYSARYFMSDIIMDAEENVCNTLARMLIYLIENKIMEIK